jgi:hypothetical protein
MLLHHHCRAAAATRCTHPAQPALRAGLLAIAGLIYTLLPVTAGRADVSAGTVIGGFAEVANRVTGALPGQEPAVKQAKSPAHFGERVTTVAGGRANISLIDGSHVLVGEKAELTIDAFVFDPKSGAEKAAYSIAGGALRFISGAIKGDQLKIQTPTAALIVRGTNFKLRVTPAGDTVVAVNRGSVEVTARSTFQTATLGPGQSIRASREGLSDAGSGEVDVEDGYVDDPGLDGTPDLADVSPQDLGFSDEQANEIEDAVDAADGGDEGGDGDGGDGDGGDGDGGDGDGGDGGGDSGGDGGGDSGSGDSGGGDGGGGGE